MSSMEHLALLQLEEGRPFTQSSAMASIYRSPYSTLAVLQYPSRDMETPDVFLQEVYKSAKDIARVERPLSMPAVQPLNFGLVIPGVYRSSYPQTQDYDYLRGLKLKTIVTLVQRDHPEGFQSFIDGSAIKHKAFNMMGTKKADIPLAMMQSILRIVADKRNYPLLIHCNHGKHRTGCVVGVLRKFNGWDTPSILAEYTKYAEPKIRETDVEYLTNFKLGGLRRMVAQKLEDQPLSTGQFFLLTVVTAFSLYIWALTLKFGVCVSPPPPRETSHEREIN